MRDLLVAAAAPLSVSLLPRIGSEREQLERELERSGLRPHLFDRMAWNRHRTFGEPWLLVIRDEFGVCRGAVSLAAYRSRALPGHFIVRAERCGALLPSELSQAAAAGLRAVAQSRRVLRLTVELFARDIGERALFAAALADQGFTRMAQPHHYDITLRVDLTPSEAEILGSFSRMARRHIKNLAESEFELRVITDPRYVSRLDALADEAMHRTGGDSLDYEHRAMIELSRTSPELSRLVGIFRRGDADPQSLVAYAWGGVHGDYSGYDAGAASRIPGTKLGFSYPLLWDLMCWAKGHGANWFDMGGVSGGGLESDDPVGGISDFKRYFSKDTARVAEDWMLEPHPSRLAVARVVSAGAHWVSGALKRQA
jgi:hypothetical protein